MTAFHVGPDSATRPDVVALVGRHRAWASQHSPPEDVHAMAPGQLEHQALDFYTARTREGILLGMGALRELDAGHAELKAMHVSRAARGMGVGRALLDVLLEQARQRGYRRVSLETGTMDAFQAARTLYASRGFAPCPPFGDYAPSPNSLCMTLLVSPTTPDRPEPP